MTDACKDGLAYILLQEDEKLKAERVIEYSGRATRRVEKGYAATLLELLAVVCGLKHYKRFCIQHRVKIITDHKALLGIMKKRVQPFDQIDRLRMYLNNFEFDMVYRKGKDIGVADMMSRIDWGNKDEPLINSEEWRQTVTNNQQ